MKSTCLLILIFSLISPNLYAQSWKRVYHGSALISKYEVAKLVKNNLPGAMWLKHTKFQKVRAKWFRYAGLNRGTNAVVISLRVRVRLYENALIKMVKVFDTSCKIYVHIRPSVSIKKGLIYFTALRARVGHCTDVGKLFRGIFQERVVANVVGQRISQAMPHNIKVIMQNVQKWGNVLGALVRPRIIVQHDGIFVGATADLRTRAKLTWVVTDKCGKYWKYVAFFDRRNGKTISRWHGHTPIKKTYKAYSFTVQCLVGHKICYGASMGNTYWGIGYRGRFGCKGCCTSCQSKTIKKTLTCK